MAPAIPKAGPLSSRRFGQEIGEKEAYARNFYQQRNGPRHAQNLLYFSFYDIQHLYVLFVCFVFLIHEVSRSHTTTHHNR